jgi:hypothetical protein
MLVFCFRHAGLGTLKGRRVSVWGGGERERGRRDADGGARQASGRVVGRWMILLVFAWLAATLSARGSCGEAKGGGLVKRHGVRESCWHTAMNMGGRTGNDGQDELAFSKSDKGHVDLVMLCMK